MKAIETGRVVVERAREEGLTFMAASIAFYAFFSIIPLLLLTLVVGSALGEEGLAAAVVDLTEEYLSDSGEEVVEEALSGDTGQLGASVGGLLALGWSALKVFRAVDVAFDDLYRLSADTSFLDQVKHGLVVLLTVVVALAALVAVESIAGDAAAAAVPFAGVLTYLGLGLGLVIVFLPLYTVMSPPGHSVREAVPGAVLAAAGWVVLQALFSLYAANADQYQAYGIVGAVLLFLTWLYLGAILVLLGAAVNAVLSER
jgi:membrane protein